MNLAIETLQLCWKSTQVDRLMTGDLQAQPSSAGGGPVRKGRQPDHPSARGEEGRRVRQKGVQKRTEIAVPGHSTTHRRVADDQRDTLDPMSARVALYES